VSYGLLQRVGGGYQFVHRMIQEYFIDLEIWSQSEQIQEVDDKQ
jgi:hypothetical protein